MWSKIKVLFFKKSLEDRLAASFYEKGRWVEVTKNAWTDTKTGAVLTTNRRDSSLRINDVCIPQKAHAAFWEVMYESPRRLAEQEKINNLEKLYENN